MAKRSWPFGVTSWDDTVKFAQLLFGVDVAFENYAERLPHRSNKSFLLFAKGACAEGRPFFEIGDFIAPQLEEIQQWEENVRNNNARPTKSQQMLKADGWTVYYWSAQVTRAPCLCRSIFGADAHQKHVPTSSAMWKAGSRFEKLWDATLMKNYEAFQNRDLRPTWLDKSWQVSGELAANSDVAIPEAEWRTFSKPSAAMARKVAAFEKSAGGFKLALEQLSACRWFGEAMDVALQEEENKTPLRNRAQHACLLIGAGGTGKTTIILELMLDVFCRFFPARPGEEERYMIATFSHAQSDAISNDVYRARTCHTACSYRVASLRNKHLALKTKEQEMKQRWQPKILVIQDEISLVPAAVENMMLYRSMRARQDEGLDPASYFHPGELMGHIPILLIAGDFLQIKPANEISLADNLEELIRKMPHRVQTEHHAAQAALMTIDTVIHLKKSKRFLDAHLPEITTAMRTCTPAAPLSEDHLAQLRTRKIENCKKELTTDLFKHGHVIGMYWENIARSMVERANRDAQDLDVPLFCLQAADQRHSRKNKAIDKQLTHQLLTVPNPHRTGKLQGMLLVHENMVVRLADVLAPHLGLVKDKLAVVVKVDLHHEDQKRLDRREPGFCHFFPDYMAKGIWVKLLKGKNSPMEDALLQTWKEKFQNVADHTTDAKTLFFVELVHAEFKIDLKLGEETEKIEVIRWQFPLLHGMLRTAYSAQGLTLDGGVLVDLRRGGGLEDADWWLAIYVMLTRARKLKNLILLGFTEQVEELLRRGPPTYLRELTDKLETKAASTLERLQSWPVYDALQAS